MSEQDEAPAPHSITPAAPGWYLLASNDGGGSGWWLSRTPIVAWRLDTYDEAHCFWESEAVVAGIGTGPCPNESVALLAPCGTVYVQYMHEYPCLVDFVAALTKQYGSRLSPECAGRFGLPQDEESA